MNSREDLKDIPASTADDDHTAFCLRGPMPFDLSLSWYVALDVRMRRVNLAPPTMRLASRWDLGWIPPHAIQVVLFDPGGVEVGIEPRFEETNKLSPRDLSVELLQLFAALGPGVRGAQLVVVRRLVTLLGLLRRSGSLRMLLFR